MADRCTGHCCRNFLAPLSPDELRAAFLSNLRGGSPSARSSIRRGRSFHVRDIEIVAPMLRYKGVKFLLHPEHIGMMFSLGSQMHVYSCRHLLDNSDCDIYDARPDMCRNYPTEAAGCDDPGCTWDEKRAEESYITWEV